MLKPFVIPRLPKPTIKSYIRPNKRENKAMTAAVGLRCKDSVILAADRQVSLPGAYKYNECKINIVRTETTQELLIFAYSGLPSLAREAREKIAEKLSDSNLSEDSLYAASDDVLTDMGRHYSDMQLQLLIGHGSVLVDPQLLKFDGKGLHKADNYSFLGVGDSALLRFLAETLYLTTLSEDEGANLAIYLVQKATDYIDGCGGPIDVAIMNWTQECVTLSEREIQQRLKNMERQESKLTDLIIRQSFSSSPT